MDFKDKAEFTAALEKSARKVGRDISQEDEEIFYEELKDYPLKLVLQGMTKAIRDRDPADSFLRRALLSTPEIRAAMEEIADEQIAAGNVSRCEICNGSGWITGEDEKVRILAWPCRCLYEAAKAVIERKKRPGTQDARMDAYRKRIVGAYEYHEKKWGG